MADIIVARLRFPNDPTGNLSAHQMFWAEDKGKYIELYSISSILGKERRVYGNDSDCYVTILPPEHVQNGFKVPSFIDCTKMYRVTVSGTCNLMALTRRNISIELRKRIEDKIAEMKLKGRHRTYPISERDFCLWNSKVCGDT